MRPKEAEHLLGLSREARWTYPSSLGRPVAEDAGDWVARLVAEQEAFVAAARLLLEAGDADAATEIAANVWRLWVLSGDDPYGELNLAAVAFGRGEASPTRSSRSGTPGPRCTRPPDRRAPREPR